MYALMHVDFTGIETPTAHLPRLNLHITYVFFISLKITRRFSPVHVLVYFDTATLNAAKSKR